MPNGEPDQTLPEDWKQSRISLAEAERRYTPGAEDDGAAVAPEYRVPFGSMNAQWEALKARMLPGDELWTFSSPPESWEKMYGRSGVALLRGAVVIDSMLLAMN